MATPDAYLTGRLAPHSMLQGRYLIMGLAGQGGMGAVYQAIDTKHTPQRQVAIKEMSQSKLKTKEEVERARKRFRGEAAMLRALDHACLPRVYASFEEDGRSYLVMEFIAGQTLKDRLLAAGSHPLPTDEVLGYAYQLCNVLDYLHRQYPPIVFRDLKPDNIMVKPDGQIVLIDFGIARFFKPGKLHDTEGFMTIAYASPEQRDGKQTDARSDLYSLGATLHHCLTGNIPAYASNNNVFPPISRFNAKILPRLDQAILELVEADRDRRPNSANAFLKKMIEALADGKDLANIANVLLPPSGRAAGQEPIYLKGNGAGVSPDEATAPPNRWQDDSEPLTGWLTDLVNGFKRLAAGFFPVVLAMCMALGHGIITVFTRPQNGLKSFAELGEWFENAGLAIRTWSSTVLTPWFIILLLGRLALLIIGSIYLFHLFNGSTSIVAFCLALIALLITASSSISTRVQEPIAKSILFCTAMALLLACFALQTTPDVQALLHRITFSQLLLVILLTGGLITLVRTSTRLTWVDYVTVVGIASTCALLQYTLGTQEPGSIPAIPAASYTSIIVGLTAILAFIAFIALCRLGSSFSGFDRWMVLVVAVLFAFLQFTVGYQELLHLPMVAPGVSMSHSSFLNVAYIYLLLVIVPLGMAMVAVVVGQRFAYVSRVAIFLLAAASAVLQNAMANDVSITLPSQYSGSFTVMHPLAQVIASSFTFNQLFTYGGLLVAGLLLLVRLFRPIDWINRPAVLLAAAVGTLLQSAFWSDEVNQMPLPSSSQLSGFSQATLFAANNLVVSVLLLCVAIGVGLTISVDLVRLLRQISWVNSSTVGIEQRFKWVNGTIKVVDRLLIIGLTLISALLAWFFTPPPQSFLAQPMNRLFGLENPTITLNQVVAVFLVLCFIIALFRIGGKFNRWDCITILLASATCFLLALGSSSSVRDIPPVLHNVQQFVTNVSQQPSATILLVFGLAFAGAISLFWVQRVLSRVDHVLRFVLFILFVGALVSTVLYFVWPLSLAVALIFLLMGLFVAIQMERVR
ncbi:MAG: serine/threonine-protein kinase [Ktedonobacteraceae bacterium]